MAANVAVIDFVHEAMWNRSSGSILYAAPWRRTPVTPLATTLSPRTTAAARPGSLCFAQIRSRIRSNFAAEDAGVGCRSVEKGKQPLAQTQPNPPKAMRRVASRRVIFDLDIPFVPPAPPNASVDRARTTY